MALLKTFHGGTAQSMGPREEKTVVTVSRQDGGWNSQETLGRATGRAYVGLRVLGDDGRVSILSCLPPA